jgi:prefoldin subunit 5
MKKGLLTVLLASLVLVGCQNYDDQFDDLNAQISALKSQVDGLSSLSGQVSSLSGSISGLQAGVSAAQAAATAAGASADAASAAVSGIAATDLSGLEASLATLAAEVDAVQASLALASTATAVAALQAEIDAIEADVDELLATSNVYTSALSITTVSELDAAYALGNNINIVNNTVNISQTATMDATKLQTVIDRIFTVTSSFTYTTSAATNSAMTFDKLASTGDLSLTVNGPISAKALVTAANITLGTTYTSKVTSINMDLLTSVDDINSDTINFPSATDIQLGSLAVYTDALSITTKKGSTLDIASLDDLNSAGTAVDMSLTVSGPASLSISGWDDSYAGTITATNIADLTIAGYEGAIVIGDGIENVTVTGGVDVSLSSADDLVTVNLTTKLYDDPNVAATATAKVAAAYGNSGEENSLSFSSTNLTSVTLSGYWLDVTSSGNGNLTTVDIDATMRNLNLTNNDNLTELDVTGASIANVTLTGNDGLVSAVFDHTTGLNYNGASATDTEDVDVTITDNLAMTSLTFGADKVEDLTVTGNDALTTVDFTGLAGVGADADGTPALSVYDNALTATAANDSVDGLATGTQYSIDGTNDASDEGAFTTTSGLGTLKTYMTAVKATTRASAAVNFDIVESHTIATDAGASGETEGVQNSGNVSTFEANGGTTSAPKTNWVGLVYADTASDYVDTSTTTGAVTAAAERRAFILDVSALTAGTTTINVIVGGTSVLHTGSAYGNYTASSRNLDLLISEIKSSQAVSRAADLGATLDVYKAANSTMAGIEFKASFTSASGGNFENYTDAEVAALYGGNGTLTSKVTSYDSFVYTVGGRSVTVTLTLASGATSYTGQAAANAVADQVGSAWDVKYGTDGSVSGSLSFWAGAAVNATATTADTIDPWVLKSAQSGSRGYGQTTSFVMNNATAAQISTATAGLITNTYLDWTIGSTDATTDNGTTAVDLIISLTETTEDAIATTAMSATVGSKPITELTTAANFTTGALTSTLVGDIFPDDPGTAYGSIYGGGSGDAARDEAANEGVTTASSTGSVRATLTRLHWLS